MNDIPLRQALLLWNRTGRAPHFAVRPLGHPDYDKFDHKVGACFRSWQEQEDETKLRLQLLVEVWHAAAFYGIPVEAIKAELLCIPEYRDMLADDCLPREFWHERD